METGGNVPPEWTRDLAELTESLRRLEAAVVVLEGADPSDDGSAVRESRALLAKLLPRTRELLVTVLSYVGASLIPPSGNGEPDFESASALAMAMSWVNALGEINKHLPELFGAVEGLE